MRGDCPACPAPWGRHLYLRQRPPLLAGLQPPSTSRDLGFGLPRDTAMAAQFGWAPLASPLDPDFDTSAAAARPILRAPNNVRSYGTLYRSSAGARVLSPYFVGRLAHFTIVAGAAATAFPFSDTRSNQPDILNWRRWPPRPVNRAMRHQ